MPRLIHLNGAPGVGKSTLARRWADEHPGTLCCDVDLLRTMIGGWERDFGGAGALIRPVARAVIGAHLANGRDVVFPQLLADPAQVALFAAAATDVGASYEHRLLLDPATEADPAAAVARFHRRGAAATGADAEWHARIRAIVAEEGGDDVLLDYRRRLADLRTVRPEIVVVTSVEDDVDGTYRALAATLDPTIDPALDPA